MAFLTYMFYLSTMEHEPEAQIAKAFCPIPAAAAYLAVLLQIKCRCKRAETTAEQERGMPKARALSELPVVQVALAVVS